MSSVKCQWVSQQLSKPPSECLLEHEKIAIESHLEQCSHCREAAVLAKRMNHLAHLEPPGSSPFADKKIIEAALEGRMPNQPRVNFFPYFRPVRIGLIAAALGTAAVAIFLFMSDGSPVTGEIAEKNTATHSGTTSPASNAASKYNLFTFQSPNPLTLIRNDKVWGTESTIVNLEQLSAKLTHVDLIQGKIVAHVSKRKSGEKFIVTSPRGIVEVVGTVFSVELDENGAEHVRVLEGTVKVTDSRTGAVHMVEKNMQFTLGAAGPIAAAQEELKDDRALMTPDTEAAAAPPQITEIHRATAHSFKNAASLAQKAIDEQRLSEATRQIERAKQTGDARNVPNLLARLARAYRQQKNYTAAKDTYQRLIREYRASDAAKNALVALAQLELNVLGETQSALERFNTYLAATPNGYLAEEAWIGRARALRSTGQQKELLNTADAYLSDSAKTTFRAEMLLYRADMRLQSGNCSLAENDYKTIIAQWPDSKKARQAQQGLTSCSGTR